MDGRRRSSDGGIYDTVVLSLRLLLVLAVDVLGVLNSSGLGLNLLLDIEVRSDESGSSPSGDAGRRGRGREREGGQQRQERRRVKIKVNEERKQDSLCEVELVDLVDGETLGLGNEEEDEDERSGDESSPD